MSTESQTTRLYQRLRGDFIEIYNILNGQEYTIAQFPFNLTGYFGYGMFKTGLRMHHNFELYDSDKKKLILKNGSELTSDL